VISAETRTASSATAMSATPAICTAPSARPYTSQSIAMAVAG